jgi:hypothetical protein
MNTIEEQIYMFVDGIMELRDEALDQLSDADLDYSLPNNPSIRDLLLDMGKVQISYTESFKTFTQTWDVVVDEAHVKSVASCKAWFKALNADMRATVTGLSQEVIDTKEITRDNFTVKPFIQVDVFLQAALIHMGKMVLYLRGVNQPISEKMMRWIG